MGATPVQSRPTSIVWLKKPCELHNDIFVGKYIQCRNCKSVRQSPYITIDKQLEVS